MDKLGFYEHFQELEYKSAHFKGDISREIGTFVNIERLIQKLNVGNFKVEALIKITPVG